MSRKMPLAHARHFRVRYMLYRAHSALLTLSLLELRDY